LKVAPPSTWAVNFTPLAQVAGAAGAAGAVAAGEAVSPADGLGALGSGAVCAQTAPLMRLAAAHPASNTIIRLII
jgi:hypothetical protein